MLRSAIVGVLLGSGLLGQTVLPETPAGAVLSAWLVAFNSADAVRIRAFEENHRLKPIPDEQVLRFREVTGGFTLLRVETNEPLSITALLKENHSDTVARFELTVSSENPPKIVSDRLLVTTRPAEFAIPRLTEGDALRMLAARANELATNDQFSGAVLVARRGNILLQRTWGRADREDARPVTLDTQFRIGSMNKMFTAVAVLQLVEAGKLALSDPVGRYLPEYPNQDVAAKVTVRHLLTHTGGTGDIFSPEFTKNRLALRELSDYVKLYGSRALTHEPGQEHRYSNYGYILLGAIIERISGTSYHDYVRTKVFQAAGMTSSDALPETETVPNRAKGYMRRNGGWVPNTDTLPWRATSAGGGYSTVGDLFRFAHALEAGRLLSKAMLADATKTQVENYGYGFGVQGDGPLRSFGHGGGAPGMNGDLRVFPDLGYVLVGLSNFDPPAASRVIEFFALRMPVGS